MRQSLLENATDLGALKKFIGSGSGWYQGIDLGKGLVTKGTRIVTSQAMRILPMDMTGWTVLDIGCSVGGYLLESWRRGAVQGYGVDYGQSCTERAKKLMGLLGLSETLRIDQMDLYTLNVARQYDLVVCMSVMHHIKWPARLVKLCASAAKKLLVFECIVKDTKEIALPAEVAKRGTWYPSIVSMENAFRDAGFARVERLGSTGKSHTRVTWKCWR